MADVRAVVLTGPRQLEMQSFARPSVGTESALLRLAACGICGSCCKRRDDTPHHPGH